MKVSLNLVKFYNEKYNSAPDPYGYGVDNVVTRIGAQLGAIEEVIYTGKKYEKIVVAKVVSCLDHPNADKLHVCLVDDGGVTPEVERNGDGYVQVVCGAPNVREGMIVAWLPPGSVVPSTAEDKEPFMLGSRELRGIISNGMLASSSELGLSDDHSGILEIRAEDVGFENCTPGTAFKNLYGLDDVIIDCENKMFTHRPDCFGTLGVAREIAGIFGDTFTSPNWYTEQVPSTKDKVSSLDDYLHSDSKQLQLTVENNAKELVPRFMCQMMTNVNVGKSPIWLQSYLSRVGSRSISNVVDYSNYFMMLTGQPTHAFDYDKVKKLSDKDEVFGPRMARSGEKLPLLNGKEVSLTSDDIVIAYGDTPIALAGIMGGADTEVDDSTKNIIIECATFDMYAVRRTTMRLGVFSDAATRYTKGQSPRQNASVLALMISDFERDGIAEVASAPYDVYEKTLELSQVKVTSTFINERLGTELAITDIKTLLESVEFGVVLDEESLFIAAPFWRMDIELPEDIVEEVGRLYGYDKIAVFLLSI